MVFKKRVLVTYKNERKKAEGKKGIKNGSL